MTPNTKPIRGYNGYSITKDGQVYSSRNSADGRFKKVKTKSNGQVTLCRGSDRKQRPVRLLLLEAWGKQDE